MSVVMETENDETKSCVFYGFLDMYSVDRHDTFVELLDQRLSKIKDSSAKRQDGLRLNLEPVQSKLYSHNGCYLHYTSSYHIAKYLKRNPPTQKSSSVEEPVAKRRRSTLLPFNFKETACSVEKLVLGDQILAIHQEGKKSILCRTADQGKGKKNLKDVILQICHFISMTMKI